uniref:Medium-chain acyl-CoA ligase ACSF2, mitochondrial n=1 Tax=Pogona vitticeps TaxID=103695 RepID=A0ABM5FMT7_9SAUR
MSAYTHTPLRREVAGSRYPGFFFFAPASPGGQEAPSVPQPPPLAFTLHLERGFWTGRAREARLGRNEAAGPARARLHFRALPNRGHPRALSQLALASLGALFRCSLGGLRPCQHRLFVAPQVPARGVALSQPERERKLPAPGLRERSCPWKKAGRRGGGGTHGFFCHRLVEESRRRGFGCAGDSPWPPDHSSVQVSVNPAYQYQELEFVLRKVGCKALVFPTQFKTQKYYEILKLVCPELEQSSPGALNSKKLPELSIVISTDSKLPGTFSVDDLMQAGESSHKNQLQDIRKTLDNQEPINIQFTSGTTGSPKGATLSHSNIVNNAYLIGTRLRINDGDARCCLPVPLYHCLGSVAGCVVMAVHGVCLVFPNLSFDAKATLKALDQEKCTHVHGTPTMFIDILGQPDFASYNLSNLRGGLIAGSPVPPEVMKKIIKNMNMREIVVAYGTTENSPVTFMGFPQDNITQKTETVGCIFPHTEAKIEDPNTGEFLPLNSPGELQIKGYCVMLGYWGDPNKTNEVMTGEKWYKTGDIAMLDEHGYCKIVGRCKDMIIRGGENIYPAELEQFLHTHPKIHEVQVVGVKDARMGEEICASIRVKEGEECTAEEIKAFCKGKISHFKIPRYIVFVKDFPLTVSGKIQKYKLRERMEAHLKV